MNSHAELDWIALDVSILPPQESEVVSMLEVDLDLMKHSLDITHESHSFFSETTQYSSKVIGEVWAL